MNQFIQWHHEIIQFLDAQPPFFTPGLRLRCYYKGQKVVDLSWGQVYTYYDLASLTKPLFILSAILLGAQDGDFDIDTPLNRWYPQLPSWVTVGSLLAHQGYFQRWLPFYQDKPPVCDPSNGAWLVQRALTEGFQPEPSGPQYSDLGYWVLGDWLTRVWNASLEEIWQDRVAPQLGFGGLGLHFVKLSFEGEPLTLRASRSAYAPTFKCPWRKLTLQGQVEDEHAWLWGGVAPHAGLFGAIEDVSSWLLWLRAQWYGIGKVRINQGILRSFLTPSHRWKGDWVAGLMLPTPGKSSSGSRLSPDSLGHTGFTGCSFWFDHRRDWMVIVLSNRTFLGRDNERFGKVRPQLHDFVFDLILNSSS